MPLVGCDGNQNGSVHTLYLHNCAFIIRVTYVPPFVHPSFSSFLELLLKTLLLVVCFVCEKSLPILEDRQNFIIACTCVKNRCSMCESLPLFSNTNAISLTPFGAIGFMGTDQ